MYFIKDCALPLSHAVTVLQSSQWSGDGAVCVFQLKGHITPVRTLAFSPDGLALASGGVGGLMNIWSLRVRTGYMLRCTYNSHRYRRTCETNHIQTLKVKRTRSSIPTFHCVCVCVRQDGSVLQTVVAGSGAIQNIVWIPDVGVAVCSNRSKVRRLGPVHVLPCF